jgi:TrmH family RNA methyltransferase
VIRDIAGRQNHSVKLARKLQHKKYRRERGLLVGEGMDLLVAAVESRADIRDVLARRELVSELPPELLERAVLEGSNVDVGVCDPDTLQLASSLGGAADIIFICGLPEWGLADLALAVGVTMFIDGVGDPGNVGTIVRSALAFGLSGVMCSPGTADPYGPKALRAGMGAQFALPVVTEVSPGDLAAKLAAVSERGGRAPTVWVADPHQGEDVRNADPRNGAVVVLGAEREGAGEGWGEAKRLTIPQERFDSLNVAMAATVIAYELWRKLDGHTRPREVDSGK